MNRAEYEALQAEYMKVPQAVWEDLASFVRPDMPSFSRDDPGGRTTAYNEGLRAVWLHMEKRRSAQFHELAVIKEEG